jgi:hypothetical protein
MQGSVHFDEGFLRGILGKVIITQYRGRVRHRDILMG